MAVTNDVLLSRVFGEIFSDILKVDKLELSQNVV